MHCAQDVILSSRKWSATPGCSFKGRMRNISKCRSPKKYGRLHCVGRRSGPKLRDFLDRIPAAALDGLPAVTFDTRLNWPRFVAGSAAVAAAKRLSRKGARLMLDPESFLVMGREGPLADGELERPARGPAR